MSVHASDSAVVVIVSKALSDSVVLARSITVGSDHWAHYLFISSSRLGDLTVVTTQREGGREGGYLRVA